MKSLIDIIIQAKRPKLLILLVVVTALIGCAHQQSTKVDVAGLKASQTELQASQKEADVSLKELNQSIEKAQEQLNKVDKLTE